MSIKNNKGRLTKIRVAILETIYNSSVPISAPQILLSLRKSGSNVNKTTIYRELSFLISLSLIKEVLFNSPSTYYESAQLDHHHHLVCSDCGSIKDIACTEIEHPISDLEKKTAESGFVIQNHTLEFYGLCAQCN